MSAFEGLPNTFFKLSTFEYLKSKDYLNAAIALYCLTRHLHKDLHVPIDKIVDYTMECMTRLYILRDDKSSSLPNDLQNIIITMKFTLTSEMGFNKEQARVALSYMLRLGLSDARDIIDGNGEYSLLPNLMLVGVWFQCGYPTYQIGHKLAAALSVTKPVVGEPMKLPFAALLIELPSPMLSFEDGDEHVEIRGIFCSKVTYIEDNEVPHISFQLLTTTKRSFKWDDDKLEEMKLQANATENPIPGSSVIDIAASIAFNVLTWITNQGEVRPVGKGHDNFAKNGIKCRNGEPPARRVFRLIGDVTHDFRDALNHYVQGKSHKLTVQFMVSGHWRNQVHGPGRSLTKRIFIEPFWKGDKELPIALRKHKLG